jgi:hypothetical protein
MRILAVATVALLATAGCTGGTPSAPGAGSSTSGQPAAPLSPRVREALSVATAFTEGRADRDVEEMSANSIEGFINGLIVLSLGEMPSELAWQEAVDWTIHVEGCEVTDADETRPTVRCDVTHHNAISRALGVGPYPGSYHIKVLFAGDEMLGTPITSTSVTESHQTVFPTLDFTTETWRPFVTWLEEHHPDDVDHMLGSAVEPGVELMLVAGERKPLLDEASITLWHRHTAEFTGQ